MLAHVEITAPDGERRVLGHGDIIGRLWTAALFLDDPRISEAHALVSLRGMSLRLLALRGRFSVGGHSQRDIALLPGMTVTLAAGLDIMVHSVRIPAQVLGIAAPGLPPQLLQGVCSMLALPHPMLVPGLRPDAAQWLWHDGRSWLARVPGGQTRLIDVGSVLQVAGQPFAVVAIPTQGGPTVTVQDTFGQTPLRIVVRFDTVHMYADNQLAATLEGVSARLVTELALMRGPVPWLVLADELWSDDRDRALQRQRLDVVLTRLRAKLRSHGIRPDLVRSTGTGHLELLLHESDRVEDAA